jgi:flagellar FliJ protein
MKRFRFSLRPVAVIRAHREVRARERFAAAVHDYVRSEEELTSVRTRIAKFGNAIFESRRSVFNADEHAHCLEGFRRESAAEIPAERAVIAARVEMQQRRADYIEAHRELELVKRIEDKTRARHRLACDREEQAEFDDLAGRRAAGRAAV